jgi:hypothetical protein
MRKRSSFKIANFETQVKHHLKKMYALALNDLKIWIETKLFPALIKGGYGIQGLIQTEFIIWAMSNRGLSELGIYPKDVKNLIVAFENSFKIRKSKSGMDIMFGNFATLRAATPHPFAGEGLLTVSSWLELLDQPNPNYGFVPRSKLNKTSQEYIRLGKPKGGLMLKEDVFGSSGFWAVPTVYKDWDKIWVVKNSPKIQKKILEKLQHFLQKRGGK